MISRKKLSKKDFVAIQKEELCMVDFHTLLHLSELSLKYAECLKEKFDSIEKIIGKRKTCHSSILNDVLENVALMKNEADILYIEINDEVHKKPGTNFEDVYNAWAERFEECFIIANTDNRGFQDSLRAAKREKIKADKAWKKFEKLTTLYIEKEDFEKGMLDEQSVLFKTC